MRRCKREKAHLVSAHIHMGRCRMKIRDIQHNALFEEWRRRISSCRQSGKSVKVWCTENHCSTSSYYYWEKQVLAKIKIADTGLTAQPLRSPCFTRIMTESSDTPEFCETGSTYTVASVTVNGISIDIFRGADAVTLSEIFKAVRSC